MRQRKHNTFNALFMNVSLHKKKKTTKKIQWKRFQVTVVLRLVEHSVSLNSLFCSYVNKASHFEIATKSMEGIVFIRTFFERASIAYKKKKKERCQRERIGRYRETQRKWRFKEKRRSDSSGNIDQWRIQLFGTILLFSAIGLVRLDTEDVKREEVCG